jgi:hypothetical protein
MKMRVAPAARGTRALPQPALPLVADIAPMAASLRAHP